MRERTDPLVPLLGVAVFAVVLGAIGLVFYPRIAEWVDRDERVDAVLVSPDARVPVWVCRGVEGVALLMEPLTERELGEGLADALVPGGPRAFLRLAVYNFAAKEPYVLELPAAGFASPEGGAPAVPVAGLVRPDVEPRLRPILSGLGAVTRLAVAEGRRGQALLAVPDDPQRRTAFVSGELRFERKEVTRWNLARWQRQPSLSEFLKDF